MTKLDFSKRIGILFLGVLINSLGIALITQSGLGTPPITSIAFVLTSIFHLSLGTFSFIFNMLMIAGQVAIWKKDFPAIQYLQVVVTLVFSYFIDASLYVLAPMQPHLYGARMLELLIGCGVLSLGISLEVLANVIFLPGEGLVKACAYALEKQFGSVKVAFDVLLVAAAGVVSFLYLGKVVGIREGTVIAAASVGLIARFLMRRLAFLVPQPAES